MLRERLHDLKAQLEPLQFHPYVLTTELIRRTLLMLKRGMTSMNFCNKCSWVFVSL